MSTETKKDGRASHGAFQSTTFEKDISFHVDEAVGSASISPSGRDVVLASYDITFHKRGQSLTCMYKVAKVFISSISTTLIRPHAGFRIAHHGKWQTYNGLHLPQGTHGSSVPRTRRRLFGIWKCPRRRRQSSTYFTPIHEQ